uniref:Gamma-glutamyltransferase n=1 Tax=Meloidogyne floridensis TaxID=298350 RepID=A0A915NY36_9BILA
MNIPQEKQDNVTIESSNDITPNSSEWENIVTDGDAGPLSVDGSELSKQRKNRRNSSSSSAQQLKWPPPSGSLHAQYRRAAVATDHGLCSEIGRDIMMEGGNAVDAMIASFLCIGVINPQSSGLGGGFFMTIYNTSTQRCQTIDAREVAPIKSNSVMYQRDHRESIIGYRSIAVPGELHGYWSAFTKFGSSRISWKRIFEPAIKLAREGFPVSSNLAMVLQQKESDINEDEDMRRVFVDKKTGRVYEEGDMMKRERLAELLVELSDSQNPVELFYKGGIAQTLAAEIRDNGGYITVEDFEQYESVLHEAPLESELLSEELVMCGPPPPSSFAITQSIIGIMAHLTGHVPDHGTSHVVAIDHEGNAVSATSSINQLLGSKRMSPTLGIIWNDSMDDFSSPNLTNAFGFSPSPENFILPKKRPMSSMSPTVIYNKNSGKVKMAIGASGGSRIISAIAQTVIRALLFNQTVKDSVDAPRFHNQFIPHVTYVK